jgi:hypothetical protein
MIIKRRQKTIENYHEPTCLIDKVRILGNSNNNVVKTEILSDFTNDIISNRWESTRQNLKRYHYKLSCGAYMEFTPSSLAKPEIALDFNGNKSDMKNILRCVNKMRDKRFSYLEIAIDYNIDLSEFIWLDIRNKKSSITYIDKNRRLESIYIGSNESKLQYVIYDKNNQMKIKSSLPWWRVEARMRFKKNDHSANMGEYLPENLFADIKGVAPTDENIEDVAKCVYFNCFQTEIEKLSPYRRKKLANIVTTRRAFKQPKIIYGENIKYLKDTIADLL